MPLIQNRGGSQRAREARPGCDPPAPPPKPGAGAGGIKGKRPSKKDKLRAAGLLPPLDSGEQADQSPT